MTVTGAIQKCKTFIHMKNNNRIRNKNTANSKNELGFPSSFSLYSISTDRKSVIILKSPLFMTL